MPAPKPLPPSPAWQERIDLLVEYWLDLQRPHSTVANYSAWLLRFARYCSHTAPTPPDHLSEAHTRAFLRLHSQHSYRTRAALVTALNRLIADAPAIGWNLHLPPVTMAGARQPYQPRIPETDHLAPLFQAALLLRQQGSYHGRFLHVALHLLANAGLRAGELCRIHLNDLDRDANGHILSLRLHRKWRHHSCLPLSTTTAAALDDWIAFRQSLHPGSPAARAARLSQPQLASTYLFPGRYGGPISYHTLYKHFRALAASQSLHLHPHLIRHWFATDLLANGTSIAEVQALMGHRHLSHLQPYIHASLSRSRTAIERHGKRVRNLFRPALPPPIG